MLAKWDPFRDVKGMEEEFDRLVGRAYSRDAWVPPLDVRETDDRFELSLDLPGRPADVRIAPGVITRSMAGASYGSAGVWASLFECSG